MTNYIYTGFIKECNDRGLWDPNYIDFLFKEANDFSPYGASYTMPNMKNQYQQFEEGVQTAKYYKNKKPITSDPYQGAYSSFSSTNDPTGTKNIKSPKTENGILDKSVDVLNTVYEKAKPPTPKPDTDFSKGQKIRNTIERTDWLDSENPNRKMIQNTVNQVGMFDQYLDDKIFYDQFGITKDQYYKAQKLLDPTNTQNNSKINQRNKQIRKDRKENQVTPQEIQNQIAATNNLETAGVGGGAGVGQGLSQKQTTDAAATDAAATEKKTPPVNQLSDWYGLGGGAVGGGLLGAGLGNATGLNPYLTGAAGALGGGLLGDYIQHNPDALQNIRDYASSWFSSGKKE